MRQHVIVIGAGVGGLAAACYAEMNGYSTRVLELSDRSGGLCRGQKRQGYTLDSCIRRLVGTAPASGFYALWEELGVLHGWPVLYPEEVIRVERPAGQPLVVYSDIDRLEHHLRELAPADAGAIGDYASTLRSFARLNPAELALARPWETLKLWEKGERYARSMPQLLLRRWQRTTTADLGRCFSDPFLQQAFPLLHFGDPVAPAAAHLQLLAHCHNRTAGWPVGGSLEVARALEQRYRGLGGHIHYHCPVERILSKRGSATGVRLANGTVWWADFVISAADGEATLLGMLEGQYAGEAIWDYYAQAPVWHPAAIQVHLGVAQDLSSQPHALISMLEEPVVIAGQKRDWLLVEHSCFDPVMAPAGGSTVRVTLPSSYAYWRRLYDDGPRYYEEEERVTAAVMALLTERFPGLKDRVEVVVLETPVTRERATGTHHGMPAWPAHLDGFGAPFRSLSRTLPGLQNFAMAGQWAGPSSDLTAAAAAGRSAVQILCHGDRLHFWAGRPAEPRAALWRTADRNRDTPTRGGGPADS